MTFRKLALDSGVDPCKWRWGIGTHLIAQTRRTLALARPTQMTRPKAAKRRSRVVKGKPAATKGRRSAGKVGRSAQPRARVLGRPRKADAYAFAKDSR